MIKTALETWGDAASRMAHPFKRWHLEYSDDPSFRILTLEALEDFDICFKLTPDHLEALGAATAKSSRAAILN